MSKDDPLLEGLENYVVGFLKELPLGDGRRRLEPCGSGCLMQVGGIKGILTAAHVIYELKKSRVACLFTVTQFRKKARPLEFETKDMFEVTKGGRSKSADGPDIGFVRVPPRIEAHLCSEHRFYNLDKRLLDAERGDINTRTVHEVITGVIGENSEHKQSTSGTRIDTHTMTLAYGKSSDRRDGPEDCDLFDFEIDHTETVRRPVTYGGLSGAPVWRVGPTASARDRFVYGVAFYETRDKKIVCHGPMSVTPNLAELIQERFPNEFKLP